MKDRLSAALMFVAVSCAVLTTGMAAWAMMKPSSDKPQGRKVGDWRTYAAVGVSAGPTDAEIVLVEFFDFQCPACRRFSFTLDSVIERRRPKIRIVRRHFPLQEIHPWASRLALGAVCAERLGEFDQYYRRAFDIQAFVGKETWSGVEELFSPASRTPELKKCLGDPETVSAVEADIEAGRRLRLAGTPSQLINNRLYSGAWSVRQLDSLISLVR
jgi:protein-disulfide isomerase